MTGTGGPVHDCGSDVCVTCSDLAVPVRVIEMLPAGMAIVDTGTGQEEISVALVEAGPGAVVLAHAGEAIAVMEP